MVLLALVLASPSVAAAARVPSATVRAASAHVLSPAGAPTPARHAICLQARRGRRVALLRFVVPARAGATVRRATLRLYVQRHGRRTAVRLGLSPARQVGRRGWVSLDATAAARPGGSVVVALAAARGGACFAGRRPRAHAPKLSLRYAVAAPTPVPDAAPAPGPPDLAVPGAPPPAVVQETPAPPAPLPPPVPFTERRLLVDDRFDGPGLDPATWADGYWASGNDFYAPANVSVGDGRLRLRAASATSAAMVQTLGRVGLERGRVEVRARTPRGQGLWPAIWLRPVDLGQLYPEIDLLETWQTDAQRAPYDAHTLWMNFHWLEPDGTHIQAQTTYTGPDDLTAGMHAYAVEWKPGRVTWYVDGVRRGRIEGPQVATTPMFLVLSLQIGAWWLSDGGYPSPQTHFPADFEVDRVRIWEDPPGP